MKWLWWQPLLGITFAALAVALFLFRGDVPREIFVVLFVMALVATSKLLRNR